MTDEAPANYLRDLGDLVKRSALEARAKRDEMASGVDQAFESGRLTASYEVVSLMQQQAVAFGMAWINCTSTTSIPNAIFCESAIRPPGRDARSDALAGDPCHWRGRADSEP